jgi:hypothetical protein
LDEYGSIDMLSFQKSKSQSKFIHNPDYFIPISLPNGHSLRSINDIDMFRKALMLAKETNSTFDEDYTLLKIQHYGGLNIGLFSSEKLLAFSSILWSLDGEVFFHLLSSKSNDLDLKILLLEGMKEFLTSVGISKINLLVSIEDFGIISILVNSHNFKGVMQYLDPYGDGKDYIHLRVNLEDESPQLKIEPEELFLLRDSMQLGSHEIFKISQGNHQLIELAFVEGYELISAKRSGGIKDKILTQSYYVFRRPRPD